GGAVFGLRGGPCGGGGVFVGLGLAGPAESSLIQRVCHWSSAAYFWLPSWVSLMSGERRWSRFSMVSIRAWVRSWLTDAWTACLVRPIRRAIWGTVSGRPARATAPSPCQRDAVNPSSAASPRAAG